MDRRTSRIIRVDPDVLAELTTRAKPGETPNRVLRRIFRLPKESGPVKRSTMLKAWEDGQ